MRGYDIGKWEEGKARKENEFRKLFFILVVLDGRSIIGVTESRYEKVPSSPQEEFSLRRGKKGENILSDTTAPFFFTLHCSMNGVGIREIVS